MSIQNRKLDSRGMPLHPHSGARRVRATSFAAVLLVMIGVFHVIQGLAALTDGGFFESPKSYFVGPDMVTTWGWAHLLLGIAALAAGWSLRTRAMWARGVSVSVVSLSMFVSFMWIPIYPVWGICLIAIDIAIIWALTAHGRDIQKLDQGM